MYISLQDRFKESIDYIQKSYMQLGAILAVPAGIFGVAVVFDPNLGPETIGDCEGFWHRKKAALLGSLATVATLLLLAIISWLYRELHNYLTRDIRKLLENSIFHEERHPEHLAWHEFAILRRASPRRWWLAWRRWPDFEDARRWAEIAILSDKESAPGEKFNDPQKQQMRIDRFKSLSKKNNPPIPLENVTKICDDSAKITNYLNYIQKDSRPRLHKERFLTPVEIQNGFFAPVFLITGMLTTASDDWEPVIRKFGDYVAEQGTGRRVAETNGHGYGKDISAFRMFQWNCWIVWGPSILACLCDNWSGKLTALQYGFGDENNSIDVLVANAAGLTFKERLHDILRHERKKHNPLAGGAALSGYITRPSSIAKYLGEAQKDLLCEDLHGEPNKRVVIGLINADPQEQAANGLLAPKGAGNAVPYYSAYIWVMFLLYDKNTRQLYYDIPGSVEKEADQDMRWKNLLPFFVHGNIADANSYIRYKKSLATQAWGAIKLLLEENENLSVSLVCASDETRCGIGVRYCETAEADLIRTIFMEQLPTGGEFAARAKLSDIDAKGENYDAQYTSCHLPAIISHYYHQLIGGQVSPGGE